MKLFDSEGKPTNPDIISRKQLFAAVAQLIPKMPSRQAGYVDPHQQVQHLDSLHPHFLPLPCKFCTVSTDLSAHIFCKILSFLVQAALGAAEAKIAGALKKNTTGSNKKKKGKK